MLTNFQTILPRIQYFKDLAVRVDETPEEERTGKDWFALNREYQKLRRNFAGITEMERLPGGVFVIDPKREELLVKEANRRSEEHTSELQSRQYLVCRLLLEKKKSQCSARECQG